MFLLLLKKQLVEIFRGFFYNAKTNKKRTAFEIVFKIILYFVLVFGVLGMLVGQMAAELCRPMVSTGNTWFYFVIFSLLSVIIGVFGSVFSTYVTLYLAKDNDLLLSMPVPVSAIMASRLTGVYFMGLLYSAAAFIPAVAVYFVQTRPGFASVIGAIVTMILISLVILILSCLLGYVVAIISTKLKGKSIVTVVISLLFIGAYYFLFYKSQFLIENLVLNSASMGNKFKKSAYALYYFGTIGEGNAKAMLIFSAVIVIVLLAVWFIISASFVKTITSTQSYGKKVKYKQNARLRSPFSAAFNKEMKKIVSDANYMLNCSLGTVFSVAAGIVIFVNKNAVLNAVLSMESVDLSLIVVIMCLASGLLISMNDSAAPSLSLEGKNIWIYKSLPINAQTVFKSKIAAQIVLTSPAILVFSVLISLAFAKTFLDVLALIVFPQIFVFFNACFGMLLGIKFVNLNWTNEIIPIKQSLSVVAAIFVPFIITAVLGVGCFLLMGVLNPLLYILGAGILLLLAGALIYGFIMKKGPGIFKEL